MPVEYGSESNYAKESRKWEANHSKFGAPGRPYAFQEYPKMMSRAEFVDGKGIQIVEERRVNDETEERNLLSRDFHFGHDKAFEAAQKMQTEHGILAAERNYDVRKGRLSEPAAREVREAEAAHGARHLSEVPEKPIKKRGRPAKVVVPA